MTKLYAHILVDPKRKSRWIRAWEQTPQLKDNPPDWYEERWGVSRSMGSTKAEAYRETKRGAGWGTPASYDARVVPEADAQELAAIDQAILDLQRQKQALVKDRFLTWPQVTPADCAKAFPGRSEAEAKREAKGAKIPGLTSIAQERRMVGAIAGALKGL